MIVWTARKGFIDKNRAALVDFMEDTLRVVRWYIDPSEPRGGGEDRGALTKQPAERFDWLFTKQRHLPRSLPDAEPQGAAGERRRDQGPGLLKANST